MDSQNTKLNEDLVSKQFSAKSFSFMRKKGEVDETRNLNQLENEQSNSFANLKGDKSADYDALIDIALKKSKLNEAQIKELKEKLFKGNEFETLVAKAVKTNPLEAEKIFLVIGIAISQVVLENQVNPQKMYKEVNEIFGSIKGVIKDVKSPGNDKGEIKLSEMQVKFARAILPVADKIIFGDKFEDKQIVPPLTVYYEDANILKKMVSFLIGSKNEHKQRDKEQKTSFHEYIYKITNKNKDSEYETQLNGLIRRVTKVVNTYNETHVNASESEMVNLNNALKAQISNHKAYFVTNTKNLAEK